MSRELDLQDNGLPRPPILGVAIAALTVAFVGLAARVWLGAAVPLSGDEAVTGIMANDLLHGTPWWIVAGNSYGGTAETWLAAPLLALFPASDFALRSVFVILWAGAALLTALAARRLAGPFLAVLVGCMYWLFSWSTLFTSIRAWSGYAAGGAAYAGWLYLQIDDLELPDIEGPGHPGRWRLARRFGLGFLAGFAVYQHPLFLAALVPGLVAAAIHHRYRIVRWASPVGVGILVGLGPFLLYNLRNSWASLHEPASPVSMSYPSRLASILSTGLPRLLGLRLTGKQLSFNLDPAPWVGGELGLALAGAIGLMVAAAFLLALRRPGGSRLIGITGLTSPFLLALFHNSIRNVDGRHALFLPALALLALACVWRSWRPGWQPRPLLIAALPLLWGLISCLPGIRAEHDRQFAVAELPRIEAALDDSGVHFVRGDFWMAYPLTFETNERILATELELVRFPRLESAVRDAGDRAAFIFREGSVEMTDLRESLAANPRFHRTDFGVWSVYLPR